MLEIKIWLSLAPKGNLMLRYWCNVPDRQKNGRHLYFKQKKREPMG